MHYETVKKYYHGESYTINDLEHPKINPSPMYDLIRVNSKHGENLGDDCIHYGIPGGGNSGYQAVNLAYLKGAKTILLLGFDMMGFHYFGEHPKGLANGSPFHMFIKSFETINKDIEIINCSRMTALGCFPMMTIDKVI